MIKAKDLRIGNYIYNPVQKINFKVDLVTLSNIINDNLKKSTKDEKYYYQPIELTEDILLKCGFEKSNTIFFIEEYLKFDIIRHDTENFYRLMKYSNGFRWFKYLHQLQNLYFALTNKELEIKL